MKNKSTLLTLIVMALAAISCNGGKAQAEAETRAIIQSDAESSENANTSVSVDSLIINTIKDTTFANALMTIRYDRGEYIDRFEQQRTYRLERYREDKKEAPRWVLVSVQKGVPKYKERITKTQE